MYAWVVTADHLENGLHVGTNGPRHHETDLAFIREQGAPFRMFDGDGVLALEGRIVGEYDGFEPLDDFGRPGYGCTEIQYLENGTWQTL